ncbi:zinc ribbon domain-containing protein [Denitrobacterium detoxificans]|uniref:Predicted transcriptional regulators n=1 Tax=Denitrobacterium detoxificans TaxID=79604 RepID=A0A1H8R8C7_9ACTN|nr:zinc ribbon domain-containing protein [Denitrobacterium detoxificans]SEO62193.1 Predicted transcriptional regulators [Denitrobacterium detoxificans]
MTPSEALKAARQEAGYTQEQLAAKVYVTRQAVSRWENGDSEPSIDMRKLLASVLGIPVVDLLGLPDEPACQCCGTPFSVPNMPFGTNADGSENRDYCAWCYKDGEFTSPGLDDLIERNVPYLMEATGYTQEEAVSFMGAVMPTLKRWKDTTNENASANAKRSVFYACPDCGNIVWSMGEAVVGCCGNPLDPLPAKQDEGTLEASVETMDGRQHVTIPHPMTKDDHLSFIAAVGDDLVRIKRLYPEQEATADFPLQGPCAIYAYGAKCGLVKL